MLSDYQGLNWPGNYILSSRRSTPTTLYLQCRTGDKREDFINKLRTLSIKGYGEFAISYPWSLRLLALWFPHKEDKMKVQW
ncbi:hypothetical protein Leryth_025793, partial [Lithospermum erythrorhizon]